MQFIRSYCSIIQNFTLSAFFFSWVLLVLAVPMQIAAIGETHQIFSIYNENEGCFELVFDHHKDAGPEHLSDEEDHMYHSFHGSCCFDEFLLKLEKEEIQTASFVAISDSFLAIRNEPKNNFSPNSKQFQQPPKVSLKIVEITRLLI